MTRIAGLDGVERGVVQRLHLRLELGDPGPGVPPPELALVGGMGGDVESHGHDLFGALERNLAVS